MAIDRLTTLIGRVRRLNYADAERHLDTGCLIARQWHHTSGGGSARRTVVSAAPCASAAAAATATATSSSSSRNALLLAGDTLRATSRPAMRSVGADAECRCRRLLHATAASATFPTIRSKDSAGDAEQRRRGGGGGSWRRSGGGGGGRRFGGNKDGEGVVESGGGEKSSGQKSAGGEGGGGRLGGRHGAKSGGRRGGGGRLVPGARASARSTTQRRGRNYRSDSRGGGDDGARVLMSAFRRDGAGGAGSASVQASADKDGDDHGEDADGDNVGDGDGNGNGDEGNEDEDAEEAQEDNWNRKLFSPVRVPDDVPDKLPEGVVDEVGVDADDLSREEIAYLMQKAAREGGEPEPYRPQLEDESLHGLRPLTARDAHGLQETLGARLRAMADVRLDEFQHEADLVERFLKGELVLFEDEAQKTRVLRGAEEALYAKEKAREERQREMEEAEKEEIAEGEHGGPQAQGRKETGAAGQDARVGGGGDGLLASSASPPLPGESWKTVGFQPIDEETQMAFIKKYVQGSYYASGREPGRAAHLPGRRGAAAAPPVAAHQVREGLWDRLNSALAANETMPPEEQMAVLEKVRSVLMLTTQAAAAAKTAAPPPRKSKGH